MEKICKGLRQEASPLTQMFSTVLFFKKNCKLRHIWCVLLEYQESFRELNSARVHSALSPLKGDLFRKSWDRILQRLEIILIYLYIYIYSNNKKGLAMSKPVSSYLSLPAQPFLVDVLQFEHPAIYWHP